MTRDEAAAPFGGRPAALALFLGVSTQSIYRLARDEAIPAHHAMMVARAFPAEFADWLANFDEDVRMRREFTEKWLSRHQQKPQRRLPFT